jgi:hypothetical protein
MEISLRLNMAVSAGSERNANSPVKAGCGTRGESWGKWCESGAGSFRCAADQFEEAVGVDGFVEEVDIGPVAVEAGETVLAGDEDDACIGAHVLEVERPLVALEAWEFDINEGDGGLMVSA